jgi:molybdate-binding protein
MLKYRDKMREWMGHGLTKEQLKSMKPMNASTRRKLSKETKGPAITVYNREEGLMSATGGKKKIEHYRVINTDGKNPT